MRERIRRDLVALMCTPGLSGHEDRVRRAIRDRLPSGIDRRTDRLGNLIATFPGDAAAPSVMVFAHMDQLGFVVRRIDADGGIRVERLGGVPERALASQPVLCMVAEGQDVPGIIANKAHHSTPPEEKILGRPDRRPEDRHRPCLEGRGRGGRGSDRHARGLCPERDRTGRGRGRPGFPGDKNAEWSFHVSHDLYGQ